MRIPLLMMRTRSLYGSVFGRYKGARSSHPLAKAIGAFIRRTQAIDTSPIPPADFIAGTAGTDGQLSLQLRGLGVPNTLHAAPIWIEDFEGIWQEYDANEAVWRGGRKVGGITYNTETDGSPISKERVVNGGDWVSGTDFKVGSHGDYFAQCTGTNGNWVKTPDHPSHRLTGDFTLVHKLSLESYIPAAIEMISLSGSDFNSGTLNHGLYIDIDGRFKLIRNNGSTARTYESGINNLIDGQVYFLKVDFTQNNLDATPRSETAFSFSVDGTNFSPIGSPDTNSNVGPGNSDTSGYQLGAAAVGGFAINGRIFESWIIEGEVVIAHFSAGDNPYNAPSHQNPELYSGYYTRFTRSTSELINTPDSPALDLSTQIFVGCKVQYTNYSTPVQEILASKWNGVGHQRSWYFSLVNRRIRLVYDPLGLNVDTNFITSTVLPNDMDGKVMWLGCSVDTVTQEVDFFIRYAGEAWQSIGLGFGSVTQPQIFNSTAELQCGGFNQVGDDGMIGRFYELVLYDDVNRTNLVAHFDATANLANNPTHVSQATGETWSWSNVTSNRDGQETWNWNGIISAKVESGSWLQDFAKGHVLVVNDNLTLLNGSTAVAITHQELATIPGRLYHITAFVNGANDGALRVGTVQGGTDIDIFTLFVGLNHFHFEAVGEVTHITLGALSSTKNRDVYFKYLRIHLSEPRLAFNPAAINLNLDSYNIVGNLTNAPVVTYDQIGLRGDINGATKIEDTNPVTHSFVNVGTAINSATVTLRYFIEKDEDNTRLVGVGMLLGGANLVYHFNTSTGEIVQEVSNVGTAPKVSVHQTGKWWVVCVEDSAPATATTVNVYCLPARALVGGTPGVDTTEVGSMVIGQLEVYDNTIINQVQHAPPIFTSGGTDSIDKTRYLFDLANHNQLQGLWGVKWTPLYANVPHASHAGIISLKTTASGSVLFDRNSGSQISNFDSTTTVSSDSQTWEPRDIIALASPHGDGLMDVGYNGDYKLDAAYDGEYELNNWIELSVNSSVPMDFSEISFWNKNYTESKQIGLDFMNYIPDSKALLADNAVTHITDGVTHEGELVTHTP